MSSEDVLRCFIAVDVGGDVRAALTRFSTQAARLGGDVRWVRPEAMHLTLVFLGDVFCSSVGPLSLAMDQTASRHAPFDCEAVGTGFFGRSDAPRVVWAGVGTGADRLMAVREDLAVRVALLGFHVEEREWTPHLTLGRVKSTRGIGDTVSFLHAGHDKAFGRFFAHRLSLVRSELRPDGPVYSLLHSSALAGSPVGAMSEAARSSSREGKGNTPGKEPA